MTALCAHPGCMAQLSPGNVSGVCKAHMHRPACRCAACRQIQRALPPATSEGLLPGMTLNPQWTGSR
jgi:hypothetical protein